jgi:hypothetical protein
MSEAHEDVRPPKDDIETSKRILLEGETLASREGKG